MPELTPQQKQRLQDELTKYAKEGATDDQLRTFKASLIQEFEGQNTQPVKKKDNPVISASASVEVGLQPGTENISPSTSPLKSTSEGGFDKAGMTDYLRSLRSPDEVAANSVSTKKGTYDESILSSLPEGENRVGALTAQRYSALANVYNFRELTPSEVQELSKLESYSRTIKSIQNQKPLLQINKDGTKAQTKDESIAETGKKIQADRTRRVQEVLGSIQDGSASKEDVIGLYDYEEARPFLQDYLNAYSDKDKLPATGDVLTPGEHWESAWKNSTAEQRPLAVQKIDAAVKYADGLINSTLGSVIEYSQESSFAKVFSGGDDKSFQETIAGVDVNNPEALSLLKNKLSSQVIDVKDSAGNSISKEKRAELLKAIEYKIDNIKRSEPLAEELKDKDFSDKLYYAIGDIESAVHEITTNKLTERQANTDEKKYSAIVRGLNYYKSIDPALYTNVLRAVKNNGEIAESDYQQLLSKGQQLENFNTFVGGAQDKELIGAETNFNLDTRGSLVAKRSGALGETAKQLGLTNKMSFSDSEIELLNKKTDWAAYGMRPPTETELDLIKTNEGKWFYDQIPKSGGLSVFVKGVEQPFLAIARTAEDLASGSVADDYLRSKQLDRQTSGEQLTPDEKGQYGSGLASDRGNVWYSILEGAGSFLPQILLTKGLGAPISGAAKITAGSIPRAALTAEQLFTVNTTAGTLLSSYLQGYGDSYERALQKTGDPVKAEIIGNIGGIIDGVMEQWLPETRIGQGILRNLKGDISERIATVVRKGGDLDAVLESTKGILKPFVSQYLNVTGQEMAEEGTGVLLKQLAESIVSPQTAMDNDVAGELAHTLWSTALQTFIPAISSGAASAKNRFTKQVFNESASKFDYTKDVLNKALNIGSLSQDEYNKSISLLKTHQNSLIESPKIDANGNTINSKNRTEYAYQETLIKINNEKAAKATDVEKEVLDKKINESKAIQRSILMPETSVNIVTVEKTDAKKSELDISENAAIIALKEKDLTGTGLESQSLIINDDNTTVEQKRAALKEISDQLLAPATAETTGTLLGGKLSQAIDNLMYESPVESEVVQQASVQQPLTNPALIEQAKKFEAEQGIVVEDKLTETESNKWDSLSMEDKRKLATENLPEIDSVSNVELIKLADKNAKFLLAKMRGEDTVSEEDPNIKEIQNQQQIELDNASMPVIALNFVRDKATLDMPIEGVETDKNGKPISIKFGRRQKAIEKEMTILEQITNCVYGPK